MAELKKHAGSDDPVEQLRRILLADNIRNVADLESRIESFQLQWRDNPELLGNIRYEVSDRDVLLAGENYI